MTEENKRLRDTLKAIEGVITTSLAHQPENDAECKQHLEKTMEEVKDIVSGHNTALWVSLKYDTAVCSKCGNDIDTGFDKKNGERKPTIFRGGKASPLTRHPRV